MRTERFILQFYKLINSTSKLPIGYQFIMQILASFDSFICSFVLVCSKNGLVLHNRVINLKVYILVVIQVYLDLRKAVIYIDSIQVAGPYELWTVALLRSRLHQSQLVHLRDSRNVTLVTCIYLGLIKSLQPDTLA
jgi:hypothetical protein